MKKILYLFSDTGGGHRASANALIKAVDQLSHGKIEQEMVDVFAECGGLLNIFVKMYSPVIKYTPKLWGVLWYMLDDEKKLGRLQKMSTPLLNKQLKKLILAKSPDLIVSVHPLLNHVTTEALKSLGLNIPMLTVVTDPVTFYRSWVDPAVGALVVATEEAKQRALELGMPEEKIKLLGLPIRPDFALKDEEKARHRALHALEPKLFTVLMMGGGEGGGKMFDIIKELSRNKLKIQVIVIAGRNKKLVNQINKAASSLSFPIIAHGFTEEVAELMSESDIIITKGGPGSIYEALAMNLPMIIMSWLPGQEEGNVRFVQEENVGKVSVKPNEIAHFVKELQEDKKEFQRLKENIKRVRRPHASFDIAKLIIERVGGAK